jgi:hypothetical protein
MTSFLFQGQNYSIVNANVFLLQELGKALSDSEGETIAEIINCACPSLSMEKLGRSIKNSFLLLVNHHQIIDFMGAMERAVHETELAELNALPDNGDRDQVEAARDSVKLKIAEADARYKQIKSEMLIKGSLPESVAQTKAPEMSLAGASRRSGSQGQRFIPATRKR